MTAKTLPSHLAAPTTLPSGSSTRRIARSVGAVLAGLLVNVIASSAVDAVLHATGVYPPVGQRMAGALFLLAFAYRIVFGVAGSYVTARLAPDRPMQHAMALGVVGVAIGTAGAVVMWGAGPAWYPLALIAVTLPCAWTGGALRVKQLRAERSSDAAR